MEEEEFITKDEKQGKGSPIVLFLALLEFGAVLACLLVLYDSGDDCENPVRNWVKVSAAILGFHGVFLVFYHKFQGKLSGVAVAINSVILSFLFLWMLIGFTWIYFDSDCIDDFQSGYYLVLGLFGVYFGSILLLIVFLVGIVVVVCVGSLYINSVIKNEEEE